MRQASRLYDRRAALGRSDLVAIEAEDILASSVFADDDGDLSGDRGKSAAPGNLS